MTHNNFLSKNDIKLFEILGDILNQNIIEGVYFVDKFHWDNSSDLQYNRIVSVGKPIENISLVYYVSDFTNGTHLHSIRQDFLLMERKDYYKTNKNTGDLKYEVLGKYPGFQDILKFIPEDILLKFKKFEDYFYLEVFDKENKELVGYRLYFKDIKELQEEEKEKLIKFLQIVKRKKESNIKKKVL